MIRNSIRRAVGLRSLTPILFCLPAAASQAGSEPASGALHLSAIVPVLPSSLLLFALLGLAAAVAAVAVNMVRRSH